jgi:hypothetical protein
VIFAEEYARSLLLLHLILAAALVASCTHLVVWMRGFPRGRFHRIQAVRRFSRIAAGLFVLTFVAGNLIYPVYKVRVRAEYLDQPSAILRDQQNRTEARTRAHALYRDQTSNPAQGPDTALPDSAVPDSAVPDSIVIERAGDMPRQAAKVARWFDVKEHWVALGTLMSLGCALLLWRYDPRQHGDAIASIAFLMAVAAALAAWFGAIVGAIVTSFRAIG